MKIKKETILACDLGGTNLRLAVISNEGKIFRRLKFETPQNAEEIVQKIAEAADRFRGDENETGKIKAVALAAPATINAQKGIVLQAPNLTVLNDFPIAEKLEEKSNLPCVLENDANAAAIGEAWRGATRNFQNSICATLGTGVGGGIIIGGKILRGVDGTAGEIGHICVAPGGAKCGCGARGCLEQYASGSGIVRLAKKFLRNFPHSVLRKSETFSAQEIYKAAKTGDELGIEVFRKQGFYLGIAFAGLVNLLNPEAIVVGGGAAGAWDLFYPQMKRYVEENAYREPANRVKLLRAECGDDAGVLGAAKLAFERLGKAV